jgi:CBS domain-containing protein
MFRQTRTEAMKERADTGAALAVELAHDKKFRRELLAALGHGTVAGEYARRLIGPFATVDRLTSDRELRAELRELSKHLRRVKGRLDKKRSHKVRNAFLVGSGATIVAIPQTRRWLDAQIATLRAGGYRVTDAGPASRRPVRSAMTADVTTVAPTTPVVDAARLLEQRNVGSLPVVEGERLVGIVTDRDIALRVVAEGRNAESTTVDDIASGEPITVEADDQLDKALQRMARHQVRRLPVVEGGRLVGMLAQRDVAFNEEDERTGAVVEDISR